MKTTRLPLTLKRTGDHLELAVEDDHEFTRDVPELDFQDGA